MERCCILVLIVWLGGITAETASRARAEQPARAQRTADAKPGDGDVVLLDAWFNSQKRRDASGKLVYFHYKWNDDSHSGYSLFGQIFRDDGAKTETLYTAPTAAALSKAQVYIIVSPDIPAKNPTPHYMQPGDADEIRKWVAAGGVLMIMENDPANADLDHINPLAERFGIHFNSLLRKHVEGSDWAAGKIVVNGGGPIFHHPHTLYMKDVCTISVKPPAVAQLKDNGDVLMATAKYGKGAVFANVDPWLYNEYTDGKILPDTYDNYAGGKELVRWILKQIPR